MTIYQQPEQPFRSTVSGLSALICTGLLGLILVGCNDVPTSVETEKAAPREAAFARGGNGGNTPAKLNKQLAELRRATARFHRFEVAQAAGYTVLFDPNGNDPPSACFSDPDEGAMGFHYVNPALLDAAVDIPEPEALMYEPRKNGKLRLVGVEYVVPFSAVPVTADPPELFEEHFHANEDLGLWTLHVWVWQHNPDGMFAHWNSKVTCEHADQWTGGGD